MQNCFFLLAAHFAQILLSKFCQGLIKTFKVLGIAESKVARALLGGHAASIAKAVLHMDDIRESIIVQLLRELNEEPV